MLNKVIGTICFILAIVLFNLWIWWLSDVVPDPWEYDWNWWHMSGVLQIPMLMCAALYGSIHYYTKKG